MSFIDELNSTTNTPKQVEDRFDSVINFLFDSYIDSVYKELKQTILSQAKKGEFSYVDGKKQITGIQYLDSSFRVPFHYSDETYQFLRDSIGKYIPKIGTLSYIEDLYYDLDLINVKHLHKHVGMGLFLAVGEVHWNSAKISVGHDAPIVIKKLSQLCNNDGIRISPAMSIGIYNDKEKGGQELYECDSITIHLGFKKHTSGINLVIRYTVNY